MLEARSPRTACLEAHASWRRVVQFVSRAVDAFVVKRDILAEEITPADGPQ